MVQAWGGMMDVTPDALPVISAVDSLPGFFIGMGFSGHGFGTGPAAGEFAGPAGAGHRAHGRAPRVQALAGSGVTGIVGEMLRGVRKKSEVTQEMARPS